MTKERPTQRAYEGVLFSIEHRHPAPAGASHAIRAHVAAQDEVIKSLALLAYRHGEISEGRCVELTGMDRISIRAEVQDRLGGFIDSAALTAQLAQAEKERDEARARCSKLEHGERRTDREFQDEDACWDGFWRDVIDSAAVENEISVEQQTRRELYDFFLCMSNWSRALMSLTGGRLSKPNYTADVMISEVEDAFARDTEDELEALRTDRDALAARVERMMLLARGCHDYNGGHRNEMADAFHHGIDTVIAALSAYLERGESDTQVAALIGVGQREREKRGA